MAEKCGACGSYNTEYLYHLGVLSVRCEDCGADLLPGVVIQDKDKLLKLFEETDRQSDEQEAYIQELRHRLSLAEKVCFEANGYLKSKDNPLGRIYLDRLAEAIEKWDSSRKNKGAQYIVTEDWEQC